MLYPLELRAIDPAASDLFSFRNPWLGVQHLFHRVPVRTQSARYLSQGHALFVPFFRIRYPAVAPN